ncbi:MAG: hypothetical protein AAFX02_00725 [Pseudomonadota bacterium]
MAISALRKPVRILEPLLGSWRHSGDSDLGTLICTRQFVPILGGHYVRLEANWQYDDPKRDDYTELCIFGSGRDKALGFESFINDGSRSYGFATTATDAYSDAVAFQAEMPHGISRQIYWPETDGVWKWRVERKVKSGWNQIIEHTYTVYSEAD